MSRIRTIDLAYDELLQADPGTALTRTGLRRLVVSGQLPSVRVGTKYLLDMEEIEAYLRGAVPAAAPVPPGIREVAL